MPLLLKFTLALVLVAFVVTDVLVLLGIFQQPIANWALRWFGDLSGGQAHVIESFHKGDQGVDNV